MIKPFASVLDEAADTIRKIVQKSGLPNPSFALAASFERDATVVTQAALLELGAAKAVVNRWEQVGVEAILSAQVGLIPVRMNPNGKASPIPPFVSDVAEDAGDATALCIQIALWVRPGIFDNGATVIGFLNAKRPENPVIWHCASAYEAATALVPFPVPTHPEVEA
jgi:hypothetical protein